MLAFFLHVTHTCHASGIPTYRTKVFYIPQRPSLLPLTPRDFVFAVKSFSAQKRQNRETGLASGGPSDAWMDRSLEVGSRFGIDPILWDRNWTELSGGEGQRVMMAIGVALGTAEVLLLDGESFPVSTFPFPERAHWVLTKCTHRSTPILPCGFRTYICSGPRDCAGRGEVHPVHPSYAGERGQGDYMDHPLGRARSAGWNSVYHHRWWKGPRRATCPGRYGVVPDKDNPNIHSSRTAHSIYPPSSVSQQSSFLAFRGFSLFVAVCR